VVTALDSISMPVGPPPNAAYQSDATISALKIQALAHGTPLSDAGASYDIGDRCYNRARVMLKKTGTPTGNLTTKVCYYSNSIVSGACDTVGGYIPNGALFGTSAALDVTSLTADVWQEVTFTFASEWCYPTSGQGGDGPVSNTTRMLAIEGDATYQANNFTNDYVDVMVYSGGTSSTPTAKTEDPDSFNALFTEVSKVMAAYVYNSSWSETVRNVVQVDPGIYSYKVWPFLPPYTDIVGASPGTVTIMSDDSQTAIGVRGSNNIMDVGLREHIAVNFEEPWRGQVHSNELVTNTSTASATVAIKHDHGFSWTGRVGDVISLAESGLPTTYYRIVSMDTDQPGRNNLTVERNIDAVYTTAGAAVSLWEPPALDLTNISGDPTLSVVTDWREVLLTLKNSRAWPRFDAQNKSLVRSIGNLLYTDFTYSTVHPWLANVGAGGRFESNGDIFDFAADGPQAGRVFIKITGAGSAAVVTNFTLRSNFTGSNKELRIVSASNGSVTFENCYLEVVTGTQTVELHTSNPTFTAKNCKTPAATLTGGATTAQLTYDRSEGSATLGASPSSPTAVTVTGCRATDIAHCSSTTAACLVTSSRPYADTVDAGWSGCVETNEIRCICEKIL
jgi:hypothetical protein